MPGIDLPPCTPNVDVMKLHRGYQPIPICVHSPICQRCSRCIAHCVCSPESERAKRADLNSLKH